jgi:hypothetical protein
LFCSASGANNGTVRNELLALTGIMVRDTPFQSDDETSLQIQLQVTFSFI